MIKEKTDVEILIEIKNSLRSQLWQSRVNVRSTRKRMLLVKDDKAFGELNNQLTSHLQNSEFYQEAIKLVDEEIEEIKVKLKKEKK